MSVYDKVVELCKGHGIPQTVLEKELGFGRGSIGKLKKGNTSVERLEKIANYFHVPLSYFSDVQENGQSTGYYTDTETAKLAQRLFTDPSIRVLFDAADGSAPEDLQMAADLLKRLKEARRE